VINKIVIFYTSNKYRKSQLNSCLNFFLILKKKLLVFSTRSILLIVIFQFFFRNVLIFFCDGDYKKKIFKKNSYFLWFNTPEEIKEVNNYSSIINSKSNFFLCRNKLYKNQKILFLAPINNNKFLSINNFPKLIYISEVKLSNNKTIIDFWNKNSKKILNNLSLINNHFFLNSLPGNSIADKDKSYNAIKNYLRFFIISEIKKYFGRELQLIGKDWKKYGFDSLDINYKTNFRKKIYRGNVCLDFGSKSGCNTIYPRTVEILESGGFLVQSTQIDSEYFQNSTFNNISVFNCIDELIVIIGNALSKRNFKIDISNSNNYLQNRYIQQLENLF
jgi:hypothetical protein